jgi:homoserine acetyltransferase
VIEIATITYRSGPEWEERFGRRMLSEKDVGEDGEIGSGIPRLSPDFLIETYLDHQVSSVTITPKGSLCIHPIQSLRLTLKHANTQGERFCLTYDANSMIYLSKAMDLFDMTAPALTTLANRYNKAYPTGPRFPLPNEPPSTASSSSSTRQLPSGPKRFIPTSKSPHLPELAAGLARLRSIPTLVLGVQSDVLFPVEQQRELADALKMSGNEEVTYYELGGVWGHDTFLLDLQGVGGAIRGFLH